MKTPLFAAMALFAAVSAAANDACAPHAAQLKINWFLSYERVDGPSRMAVIENSECEVIALSGARDFDELGVQGADSDPKPRLRFWSASSPYEIRVDLAGGWATVFLIKRDGRYSRVMARIDRLEENDLASTSLDYLGDVADGEYPELRAGHGVRKTVRAARVLLKPSKKR